MKYTYDGDAKKLQAILNGNLESVTNVEVMTDPVEFKYTYNKTIKNGTITETDDSMCVVVKGKLHDIIEHVDIITEDCSYELVGIEQDGDLYYYLIPFY